MTEILTIKRKRDTKQAIGYTWVANFISLEELNRRIEEYNQKYPEEYYEICTNADLINLLPKPRRRYDCEDIVEKITDFTTEIEEMSDALDEMKNMCRDILERCKKLGDYGDD